MQGFSEMLWLGQMVSTFLVTYKGRKTIKLSKRRDKRQWTAEEEKSRPGAAALYGKPFVNFDKLFEVDASDLAKGVKAKGPRDQFEMHEELSSGNVTEATHQFENAVDSHSQPSSHDSIPASEIKSAACRKRVFVDDGMVASEFSKISKALNSLVQVEAANAEAMNAL
ncbi:uncharacterized protein [Miscanthus floridulus]|uniref:uncharacterized protein isoform X1 n=1 Tax=Miscanthus floridulus TaxID=154761 RepID=UPI003458E931